MTSPAVGTLPNNNNSGHENIDTGFPFDSDDSHFRTELEDIALRHPEFAEHLNPAQRRANANSRFRSQDPFADYRSGSRDWPFGSRIHQFGFPFTPEFDDDPLIQHQQQQQQQQQQQYQAQANERPPQQKQEEKVQEKPPQPPQQQQQQPEERSRRPHQHIQQSNTVDLGQKQEAVDDNRNQRSMSAPPENRNTSNKRFVSSINIPNFNQGAGGDNMGGRMSQPETPPQTQQQQQSNKPTERIIPIHIEGRDEPIIPKNVNISSSSSSTPPKQAPPQQQQQPQSERIFGQRPSTFTQFLNRGDSQNADLEKQREELIRQQQQESQRQQQEYQKQQQQEYQRQQEAHKPSPPPPEQKPTPLDLIQNIQKDVLKLMEDVGKFEGKPKDKQYLYLDEMLTRNLLKLDNIETEGKDSIRQARKEAIKCIEQCIGILESKANANELKEKALAEGANTETSQPQEQTETKAPETVEEAPIKTEEPMEVESTPKTEAQEAVPKEEQVKVEEKEKNEDKPPVEKEEEKTATEEKKPEPEQSEPSQEQPKEEKQEKKKGKKK